MDEQAGDGGKDVRPVAATQVLDPRRILIEEGLYIEHDLREKGGMALELFKTGHMTVDGYCPFCKSPSVFWNPLWEDPVAKRAKAAAAPPKVIGPILPIVGRIPDQEFTATYHCARKPAAHQLMFYLVVRNEVLTKVGQFPSFADIAVSEVDRFKRVLPEEKLKELKRGIGLEAHGVGIGAFVYVRRVFEHLIEEGHRRGQGTVGWDEASYQRAQSASERISLLRGQLPEIVTKNAAYYAILSKGIHELSEQECLDAFPLVRHGISVILDAVLEASEREKDASAFTSAVGRLAGAMGTRKAGEHPS